MQAKPRKLETRKIRKPNNPEKTPATKIKKTKIKTEILVYFIWGIFSAKNFDIFIVRNIETIDAKIIAVKIRSSSLEEICIICSIADAAPVLDFWIK